MAYCFGEFLFEHFLEFFILFRAIFKFCTGINIFGILAEDDHVHVFGVLHGRRHAFHILHRALANIQVEEFAQGHVQRTDAAADRGGQRAFDADQKFTEGGNCLFGQPFLNIS